tara:strand:- start:1493 stop:2245 length:753 start_codon:yes stop_codon:yes gene_type:complete
MDLVSAIIPYFKKKKFIDQSITSVLNQSYSNIEIIIIYDDEEKSDLEYLRTNYNSNKKIKIIVNDKNIGAGFSRNKGIREAKGKYVCFIDSDDIWKKEKVENQLNYMKKNNYKISHTSYEIINDKNEVIGKRKAKDFNNIKDILTSCDIGLSSVILEKNLITDQTQFSNLKTKEDFVLWLKILKSKVIIGGLDENLLIWRKTEKSLSSSTIQKLFDGFRVYKIYMGFSFVSSVYYLLCLSLNFLKKKFND